MCQSEHLHHLVIGADLSIMVVIIYLKWQRQFVSILQYD